MSFQSDKGHCGIVHYNKIDDITVSVNNSEIQPAKKGKMKRTFIIGEAYQTEPESFPNKVGFQVQEAPQEAFGPNEDFSAQFWVLDPKSFYPNYP